MHNRVSLCDNVCVDLITDWFKDPCYTGSVQLYFLIGSVYHNRMVSNKLTSGELSVDPTKVKN